jgi:hypothetical protein
MNIERIFPQIYKFTFRNSSYPVRNMITSSDSQHNRIILETWQETSPANNGETGKKNQEILWFTFVYICYYNIFDKAI